MANGAEHLIKKDFSISVEAQNIEVLVFNICSDHSFALMIRTATLEASKPGRKQFSDLE